MSDISAGAGCWALLPFPCSLGLAFCQVSKDIVHLDAGFFQDQIVQQFGHLESSEQGNWFEWPPRRWGDGLGPALSSKHHIKDMCSSCLQKHSRNA